MIIATGSLIAVVIGGLLAFGHPDTEGSEARLGRTTTTRATVPVASETWVAAENAKAGTSAWGLNRPSTSGQIEGYAGAVSARQGDELTLFVTSTAPSWVAIAYRLGWYGGKLARQIWQSPRQPGVAQAPPTRDPATNMVEAHWRPSLKVPIGPEWPPGEYLFKLVASTGWDSYIPITVRDDASQSPLLVKSSVATWQAYNLWGGYDLYAGPAPDTAAHRAKVVSFDRPYRLGNGSGDYLGNEMPLVKLVERLGLDVSYTTDVDLHQHPEALLRHRALVSLGHDEYWSTSMRRGAEAARDQGVNLLFLGANAVFRHIRFEPSPLGADRHEVNYRVAADDPATRTNPAEVTVQWRDPPLNNPESTLLGEMYECNPVHADLIVSDASAWIYAGTGLKTGDRLAGVVGSEYDHWSSTKGPSVQLFARSPVTCRGKPSTSEFTYYVAPSGAGVIDTGTTGWVPSLDNPAVADTVIRITTTMLQDFITGPAGRLHPEHPIAAGPGAGGTTAIVPPAGD